MERGERGGEHVDRISRVVFPALFLMFVTFYWPILLFKAYGV